jgi:ATPase
MKTYVPDTSAIIECILTKMIAEGKMKEGRILIHNAVLSELESQANRGKDTGLIGLTELKNLRKLKSTDVSVEFVGGRPTEFQVKYAKSGEIDAMIREIAIDNPGSIFITLDKVDAEAAGALGIEVMFIETSKIEKVLSFEKYFDAKTMSLHMKEETFPAAKRGKPGDWTIEKVGKERTTKEEMETLAKEIIEKGRMRVSGSFIETERQGSTVAQIGDFRVVIVRPPFSDGWEITIVRPIVKLDIKDYNLDKRVLELFETKASGILISGAPGNGKTTFAQAIAEFYLKMNKIVKTVEAPRDLKLPPEVTQYSKSLGSMDEIRDVLLLSRPDHTIFDEMRNSQDFLLFADMRLAGVGMVGVVHATSPIDAIQRFINRVELGVIPSIIDTVIYIQNGQIGKIYTLNMTVKVPSGMTESDLARPIVEIKDFYTGNVEYEMYTFGESTVVMPVQKQVDDIEAQLKKEFANFGAEISFKGGVAKVYVKKRYIKEIIGKKGYNINQIEKRVGVPIDVEGY